MKNNNVLEQLEPTTAEFVKKLIAQDGPPLYTLSPAAAREVLNTLQREPIETLPADIKNIMIPHGTHKPINVRIVRPQNNLEQLPIIMHFHGGGWILGNEQTHDRLVRELANGVQAAVVFVNYTPSPEAHYAQIIEQAYTATEYIARHGNELNLDSSRLVVVGDSVGGNMATVVAQLAKERGGPTISYQVLFYPVTNAELNTESFKQFANGPWLTKAAMEWFWDAYEPDKFARMKPTLSPLQASLEELKGLPPALIITAENDVLRDEGEAYAHKLMHAGVQVKAVRCLGAMHDFVMLNALAHTPPTRLAISLAQSTLCKIFNTKKST